eukprot:gene29485-5832_t
MNPKKSAADQLADVPPPQRSRRKPASDPMAEAAAELLELSKRRIKLYVMPSAADQLADVPPPQRSRRKPAAELLELSKRRRDPVAILSTDTLAEAAADLMELSRRRKDPEAMQASDPVTDPVVCVTKSAASALVAEVAAVRTKERVKRYNQAYRDRKQIAEAAAELLDLSKKMRKPYPISAVDQVAEAPPQQRSRRKASPDPVAEAASDLMELKKRRREPEARPAADTVDEFEQEFRRPNVVHNHLYVTAYKARQRVAKAGVAEFEQEFRRHDVVVGLGIIHVDMSNNMELTRFTVSVRDRPGKSSE